MGIQDQFNKVAAEYDRNRRKFIPCFDDYYINTTKLIASNINAPERIVDLGAGTGLLSYYWYQQFPGSEFVLVDIADEMLDIARRRFSGIGNITYRSMNYIDTLPEGDFDTVISALSIHHLENDSKKLLFSKLYDRLPEGGIFVNYDQYCGEDPEINRWYGRYWEGQLSRSGLTKHDIELWQERRKLDRECSAEQQVKMLRACKFRTVECVYSYQKFSVIAAIK